jgi:hypothetical protein
MGEGEDKGRGRVAIEDSCAASWPTTFF